MDMPSYILTELRPKVREVIEQFGIDATIHNQHGANCYARGQATAACVHFAAVCVLADKLGSVAGDETLTDRNNLATAYLAAGRLSQATILLETVLEERKRLLQIDHPDTLQSSNNLAEAYVATGRLKEAIRLHEFTLEMREHVLQAEHPDTLQSQNNLAAAYLADGRLHEAIKLLESNLKKRARVLPADHFDTLQSRNNLAAAYLAAGMHDEAIELHEFNLEAYERVSAADHPNALLSRNNLAEAYRNAGRLGQAIKLHEFSLKEYERVLNVDHPGTLISRNNLALAFYYAGRLNEAIKLWEFNFKEGERVLSAGHPQVLRSRHNLAAAYCESGRLNEAIRLHEFNFMELERVLTADHPDTMKGRSMLAMAYFDAGRQDESVKLHEHNLEVRMGVLKADHPDTIEGRNSLADAYRRAGRLDEAIKLYECNLKECLRVLTADHPGTLASQNGLAVAYVDVGRLNEAIELFDLHLKARLRLLTADHPNTLASRNNLASALAATGRTLEAIDLHEFNLKEHLRVLGSDHSNTLTSRTNLAFSYRDAGQFREAQVVLAVSLSEIERLRVGRETIDRSLLAQKRSMGVNAFVLAAIHVKCGLSVPDVADAVEQGTARAVLDILQRRPEDAAKLAHSLFEAEKWSEEQLKSYLGDTYQLGLLRALEAAPAADPAKVATARSEISDILVRLAAADRELLPAAKPKSLDEIRASIDPGQVMLLYGWCHLTATLTVITPVGGEECRSFLLFDTPDVKAEEARIAQVQAVAELIASGISPDIERLRAVEQSVALVRKDDALCQRLGDVVMDELPELVTGLKNAWNERQKDPKARIVIRSMKAVAVDALAREFMDFVLPAEARRMIAGASRVILIPSGPLHELPLDVLAGMAGVTELDGKPVVTAPSGSIYAMLKARKAGEGDYLPGIVGDPDIGSTESNQGHEPASPRSLRTIERELLLGDRANGFNRLPRAMQEAKDVAGLFSEKLNRPVHPLLDAQATVTAFYGESKDKRLLHVAAHAILGQPKDPMGSAVMLARDGEDSGLLRLDTLLTQWPDRLQGCDLVVLSCCQSGRGVKLGDSLMALPIGFFHAGVRCIVASLWKVDDIATWLLMRRFYENLLGLKIFDDSSTGKRHYTVKKSMALWEALADAKQYLREMPFNVVGHALARYPMSDNDRRFNDKIVEEKGCPFALPKFWAAFVIIGPGE